MQKEQNLKSVITDSFMVLNVKSAFTLAEVLITLGIIGVVAAMTLPTLISNVQDKILESQAKKAANVVANGYKLMMAQDEIFKIGDLPIWQCSNVECVSKLHREVFNIANDNDSVLENLQNTVYHNSQQKELPFKWDRDPAYAFITTDGFAYGVLPPADINNLNSFDVIADVNAKNNPNLVAKDLFKFRFSGEGGQMYDVTDELEQQSNCNVDNPSGCETREQCESLPSCFVPVWDGSTCSLHSDCHPN